MTAKLVLDTRYKSKDNLFPIAIRVRSGNQLKHVHCGYRLPKSAWGKTEVKKNYPDAAIINADIATQLANVKTKLIEAKSKGITDLAIVIEGKAKPTSFLFSTYLQNRAQQYDAEKKIKHARKLRRLLSNLQECFQIKDVPFDLTSDDMRTFNAYLKNIPNDTNTINHKFRMLGQLFNNAVKERKTNAENVFENFSTPTRKVQKEKLTEQEIAALETVVLPDGIMNDCRNLFLFSYYCKGVRFEDCVRMKRSNIINDRVVFPEIRKGHKPITVKLHSKLKALIDQYIHRNTPYLFPFIKHELIIDKTGVLTEEAERERIARVESQNAIVNRYLKVIASGAGINKSLTAHIARHSVAYNLKKKGVNLNIIQQVLGHASQAMTERYVKDLEDDIIDDEMSKLYD